jgi:hypothetical protein
VVENGDREREREIWSGAGREGVRYSEGEMKGARKRWTKDSRIDR